MPIPAADQVLQPPLGAASGVRRAWKSLPRVGFGSHVLSLADQVLVSAMGFLALILIGRWTDSAQLGIYAIGASVLALALATQEALITRPYAIRLHRPVGTPAEHLFGSLVLSVSLSAFVALALILTALALQWLEARGSVVDLIWILAASLPFVLLREFLRRVSFARLKVSRALAGDAAVAGITLVVLLWLGWAGLLSAVTAFAAVGFACGAASLAWLYLARAEFAFRFGVLAATLKQSWGLGRWLFTGQLAVQAQGYTTHWLTMLLAGAAATGVFTACATIVAFANPLLFGLINIMTPRSVHAFRIGGRAGLLRHAARDAVLLAVVMGSFCVAIFVLGEDVMRLLFPGPQYSGHDRVLQVLGLAALASAIGVPASIGLATVERVRAVAGVMTFTAVLNAVLVSLLMAKWGLLGAAYGVLVADLVGSLARWAAFLALLPPREGQKPGVPWRQFARTRWSAVQVSARRAEDGQVSAGAS